MKVLHRLALAGYGVAMRWLQPVLRRKLRQRAVLEPLYGQFIQERFGEYGHVASQELATAPGAGDWVWLHAVSLGETRAAAILIAQLRLSMPAIRLLFTQGTATGRAEGAKLLRSGDLQVWQPWDTAAASAAFLDHFKPRIGIVMETEIWPQWCAAASARGIPLVLVNARLSEKSLAQAQRLAWLARPAYQSLAAVFAQTQADAQRLRAIGSPPSQVFGNIKFDAAPDAALLAQGRAFKPAARRVVMLAASREGEEAQFFALIKQFAGESIDDCAINKGALKNIQWLVVPRHPQRFDEVAELAGSMGIAVSRRSSWAGGPPVDAQNTVADGLADDAGGPADERAPADGKAQPTVWLGDSMGEMALYYALADVALLGGSFAPLGGQNLIEAIASGCPVLAGPHTFNFAEATQTAVQQQAALQYADMPSALSAAVMLVCDTAAPLVAMRQAGQRWLSASRGASQRTVDAVLQLMK